MAIQDIERSPNIMKKMGEVSIWIFLVTLYKLCV